MRIPFSLQCPKCKSLGNFGVALEISIIVESAGQLITTILLESYLEELGSTAECQCVKCGYTSTTGEFNARHRKTYVEHKRGVKST